MSIISSTLTLFARYPSLVLATLLLIMMTATFCVRFETKAVHLPRDYFLGRERKNSLLLFAAACSLSAFAIVWEQISKPFFLGSLLLLSLISFVRANHSQSKWTQPRLKKISMVIAVVAPIFLAQLYPWTNEVLFLCTVCVFYFDRKTLQRQRLEDSKHNLLLRAKVSHMAHDSLLLRSSHTVLADKFKKAS